MAPGKQKCPPLSLRFLIVKGNPNTFLPELRGLNEIMCTAVRGTRVASVSVESVKPTCRGPFWAGGLPEASSSPLQPPLKHLRDITKKPSLSSLPHACLLTPNMSSCFLLRTFLNLQLFGLSSIFQLKYI